MSYTPATSAKNITSNPAYSSIRVRETQKSRSRYCSVSARGCRQIPVVW
ncbi:hypothetical protein ACUXMM_001360 [Micrococcus aloeverae]